MKPVRRICNDADVAAFIDSQTYKDILEFITQLNSGLDGHDIGLSDPSSAVSQLMSMLDEVEQIIAKHPAQASQSRFGKSEFRDFYDELNRCALDLVDVAVKSHNVAGDHREELATYLGESFGNRQRIDYGSGHELNFVCFILCLHKLGVVTESDNNNLILGVFVQYLAVMRRVQLEYWLEPAGSHGVWGLDDYHFLPFLFGSGQLVSHKYLRPISIHDEDLVEMFAEKNMYFSCVAFINQVKTTASLRWHSPMLDDISGVKKWAKVNQGLIKMYKAEVLGKLPVIQHFLFGSLLPAPTGVTEASQVTQEVHVQCWADCCGIRVPSAISATSANPRQQQRQRQRNEHLFTLTNGLPVD